MKEIKDPHDRFFKETFSKKEAAIDFLRNYLPPQVIGIFDLSSVELVKDTFVDKELQAYYSDLLYRVGLSDGNFAYVYVLFEHKSYPDVMVSFQLLRYQVKIWEYMLKQGYQLLPILPLVVYHGKKKWDIGLNFQELIKAPAVLNEYMVNYRYCLCDLSDYEDSEIKGAALLQVALLVMKYIYFDELKDRLPGIFKLFVELSKNQRGLDFVESVFRYLMSGTDKITEQDLKKVTETVLTEGGTLMPTIAQKYLDQGVEIGRKEGWQEGRQEGRQEGWQQGLIDGIEIVLELKFGMEGLSELPVIRKIEDPNLLRAIRDGLRTAKSLNELRRIYRNR